jgi:putative membrane protein
MILRWLVATVHILVLPLGLGAIWARARALARVTGSKDLARVFMADNMWGVAAVLWIATGLWRAFGGLEKGTAYYLHDHAFYVKMGLLSVILLLEIRPMTTLIRWRIRAGRSPVVDIGVAPLLARVSYAQAGLVILMVFAATAVARGYFY